jgi:hypothetical protein
MKHPDDKRTQELPGLPAVKRRGRPPKNEFGAMTPAERQKAYRRRVRQQLCELDPSKMSRVTLLGQLAQSLSELDSGQVEEARQVASYWSAKIVAEIVTRYELKPAG